MSDWYYAVDGQQTGPVSQAQLRQLFEQHRISADTLVWTSGFPEWKKFSSIPDLLTPANIAPAETAVSHSTVVGAPTHNPYAASAHYSPPASSHVYSLDQLDIPHQPIPLRLRYCLSHAWSVLSQNAGKVIGVSVVLFLLMFSVNLIVSLGLGLLVDVNSITYKIANFLFSTIIQGFFILGWNFFALKLLRTEDSSFSDLFSQGKNIFAYLIVTIAASLCILLGYILLIIPGIYIAMRLSMCQLSIVHKNNGSGALNYSYKLTKGNAFKIFLMFILSSFLIIAGMILLGVGLLWFGPLTGLFFVTCYLYLHGGPAALGRND